MINWWTICLWFEQAYCSSIWSSPKAVTPPWAVWAFLGPRVKKIDRNHWFCATSLGRLSSRFIGIFTKNILEHFLLTMSFWPCHIRRYPHRSHDLNESNTRFCVSVQWIDWDLSNDKCIAHLFLWGGFKIKQPKCPYLLLTVILLAPLGEKAVGIRWFRPPVPVGTSQDSERQRDRGDQWGKAKDTQK